MDKRCVLVKIRAFGIRAARRERALHAVQDRSAAACIPFKIDKTADTTHRQFLLKIVISFFYMHSKRGKYEVESEIFLKKDKRWRNKMRGLRAICVHLCRRIGRNAQKFGVQDFISKKNVKSLTNGFRTI